MIKIAIQTIIIASTLFFLGCSSTQIQDTGKVMQNMEEEKDEGYGLLGLFGDYIEIAGSVKEIEEIVKGEYTYGKGYRYSPEPTEEEKKFNIVPDFYLVEDKEGNTYYTVYNARTKKTWLDRDLGSPSQCKNKQDELCIGDYFQWGRSANGHERELSSAFSGLHHNEFSLESGAVFEHHFGKEYAYAWQDAHAENNPCPRGYALPGPYELYDEIISNRKFNYTYNGYRSYNDGKFKDIGKYATFWTSFKGYFVQVTDKGPKVIQDTNYSMGRAVRCMKKE
jgi:hypothetical protein